MILYTTNEYFRNYIYKNNRYSHNQEVLLLNLVLYENLTIIISEAHGIIYIMCIRVNYV